MARAAVAALLLFLAACIIVRLAPPLEPRALVLAHVTVIDATGRAPLTGQTVVIEDGRIAALGPSGAIPIPRGAEVIPARGKFLIPGLADMHVHLTGAGEPRGSREFFLPLLVAHGITSVRDMGGYLDSLVPLRKEIGEGKRLGPRIFFCGPYLDGSPPAYQPSIEVRTAEEGRRAVRSLQQKGVDFIKVQSRLSRVAYFAVAGECRARRIPLEGHVPDRVSAGEAADAGQRTIEHLTNVWLACSTREEELRREYLRQDRPGETPEQALARNRAWQRNLLDTYSAERAAALDRKFSERGTWQVPTFAILRDFAFVTPQRDFSRDPRMAYVPASLRKNWERGLADRIEHRTESDFALREEIVRRSMQLLGEMKRAGVRVMAGTDAAAPYVFPGSSLHEELAMLVEAGLTPVEALQAATRDPAEFLGLLGAQGTVETGKTADLVLLDADPLEDIRNTQKIRAVILRGRLLSREDLDRMLGGVARFAARN